MGGSLAVIAAHRPCRPLKFLLRLWWGMLALTSLWLGHTECTRAAQMQHVYSMFPARTGSGLHWCCGIFEMSPDSEGTTWKGSGTNFHFLKRILPILLPLGVKCSETDLIKRSDISTGASAQDLNPRLARGKERDGDTQRTTKTVQCCLGLTDQPSVSTTTTPRTALLK